MPSSKGTAALAEPPDLGFLADIITGACVANSPVPETFINFLLLKFMTENVVRWIATDKLEKNPHCDPK
jgi:hypothetical protein